MEYKEILSKSSEYYDFAIYVYNLTKSTIIGPEIDIPFRIEIDDTYPMLGKFNGSSISIYLMSLLNNVTGSDNELKNLLTLTVIHELHHVTQNIDHHKYETDKYYARMIEESCEWMTLDYITRFKDILEEFLEISIDIEYLKNDSEPMLHTKYLRYKTVDANYWYNLINSVVATTAENGMFPEMRQIIESSTSCALILEERETGNPTFITMIKYDGEYIWPDQSVFEAISRIVTPSGTIQCAYGTTANGIDVFTVIYTLSDGDNQSLYSPLIKY